MEKSYFILMKLLIFLCFFLAVTGYAFDDKNDTQELEFGYIDEYHGAFSSKVHEWGVDIDSLVLGVYNYFEDENSTFSPDFNRSSRFVDYNRSYFDLKLYSNTVVEDSDIFSIRENEDNQSVCKELETKDVPIDERAEFDEFFLTRKLLEERDKSFVRVSLVQNFHSLQEEEFKASVRARLYLGRSRERLRLFIEDFDDDSVGNIGTSDDVGSPAIGIQRSSRTRYGITPRYSIGFRGFEPFVRARYSYETDLGRWRFEPVQTFTYSLDEEFSELTEFYLDTPTSENTLLRFLVDRGTQSYTKGMRYDGFVQWFYRPREYAGLSLNLGFNGSTRYENTLIESDPPLIEKENRVYNYLFLLRWRENFWKKWLFYEIGPGVNYHEEHEYRPNYNIFFGIDLFFGHV